MSLKKLLKKKQDSYADKYYGTWVYWNSSVVGNNLKTVFEHLFRKYLSKDSEVLDLGAGRLPYRDIIGEYSDNYYSLDFKKTHEDLDYIGTAAETKLEDNRFDIVFCNQVLEHVPYPDKALREINRILKIKGVAIISTPFLIELHNEPYDYFRYTKYALKLISEDNGFEVLELFELGGIFSLTGRYFSKTIILLFYWIPLIKYVAIVLNILSQKIFGFLDKYIGVKKLFPSEYILVIRKK